MTRVCIWVLAVAACDARTAAAPVHIVEPVVEQAPKQARSPVASPAPPAQQPQPAAQTVEEPAVLPREQLIDLFVARDVLQLPPEQAVGRFANMAPLERASETMDGFLLVSRTRSEELSFNYVPDGKGSWTCVSATLEYFASNTDQSTTLRGEIEKQLQRKLGKPRTYPAAPATPYWKLVRRTEVALDEYERVNAPARPRAVAIRISEAEGP